MGFFDRLTATITGTEPVPDDARSEIDLALALADRGEVDAAELRLEEASRRYADVAAIFAALGEVRVRRGDDEGAVTAFGRAVSLSSQFLDAWLGLGETLARLGRREPADEALRKVLAGASDDERRGRAHAARGRLALRLRRAGRAARELRRAVDHIPEDASIAADLGHALRAAGDPAASAWLARAANAPDAAPELVLEAAAALDDAGAEALLRGAVERFDQVAAGAPDAVLAADLEAALAVRLARTGRLEEALGRLATARARAPSAAGVITAELDVLEVTGRFADAIAAAVAAPPPPSPEATRRLARLAIGAEQRTTLEQAAARLPAADPLRAALEAAASGRADAAALADLGRLAPTPAARRFVARLGAAGAAPAGDLVGLLAYARDLALSAPELASLVGPAARAFEAYDRPLLIAIMGEFNAGKSSLVNALVGEDVAPVGATPTTATINVLRHGPPGGRVLYHDGRSRDLAPDEAKRFLAAQSAAEAPVIRQVELFFPLPFLREVEIVDTPGWNALEPAHEAVARAFLEEADALVWIFAVGQAAKATEREALVAARAAGKRVLGLLNKADQADAAELEAVRRHVASSLGDLVEALLPVSARKALAARAPGAGDVARASSGLAAVETALEERFFSHARALKRSTALASLRRFAGAARARLDEHAAPARDPAAERRALDAREEVWKGALAAERVALPRRLETAFRAAAAELRDLVKPVGLLAPVYEAADREVVIDAIGDAVEEALEATRIALKAAASDGAPSVPVDEHVSRFHAYTHGLLDGGLGEEILLRDLPLTSASDRAAFERAVARRAPSPAELLAPLETAAADAFAAERTALAARVADAEMRALLREERLTRPLASLEAAIAVLAADR